MALTADDFRYETIANSLGSDLGLDMRAGAGNLAVQSAMATQGLPGSGYGGGIGSLDSLTNALNQQGKFGLNVPTIGLALQGLGTIGSLWAGFKQLGLANKQFEYTKKITDTNLDNSIKSYNTTLADRARARAATEGRPQTEAEAYVDKNKMTRA